MAEEKRISVLRWFLTVAVVLLVGVLVGLGLSYLGSLPPGPPPIEPVVKAMPPRPPTPPTFRETKEKAVDVVAPTQERAVPGGEVAVTAPPAPVSQPPSPAAPAPEPDLKESEPSPQEAKVATERVRPPPLAAEPVRQKPELPPPKTKPTKQESDPAPEKSKPVRKEAAAPFAYTIHLESYRDPLKARQQMQYFQSRGLEAFTRQVDLPRKGVFHRVFVGRFTDRVQAKAFQARLEKEFDLAKGRIMAASTIDH